MAPHAILAELLLPLLLAPAPAPQIARTAVWRTAVERTAVERTAVERTTVELTIVEHARGARPTRTRLELPADGKVELWVADGDERRFCEAETAHDVRAAELFISLRCRASLGSPPMLTVQARPPAKKGVSMTLAKLERADGRSLEITAKLR